MIPGIDELRHLAVKYSKKDLARMAQMGLLDPQKAVMAGMMRDRISKEDMQPPTSTVAQDVLGIPAAQPQPQMQAQAQPQMGMQQPQQAPQAPAGVEALPAGNVGNYAGGGIVAFADGGGTYGGKTWEDLSAAPNKLSGSMGEFIGNMFDQGGRRIDPVTGEEISLGEFLRRAEKERAVTPTQDKFPTKQWAEVAADLKKQEEKGTAGKQPPVSITRGPQFPGGVSTRAPATSAFQLPKFDPNAVKLDGQFYEGQAPKEISEYGKERTDYLKSQGIDPEMYANMIKGVEEKKGKLEGKKDEAKGNALMQLGLGLMGARRGQEFQTLGTAGVAALNAYKQDAKDLQAASEKYDERMEALRIADQQAKQTGAEKDIARRDAAQDKFEAAKMEKAKAQNELLAKQAQISASVYGPQISALAGLEGHRMSAAAQLQAAKIHAAAANRTPAEIQLIERMQSDPKFAAAYREAQSMKNDPRMEAKLRDEYAKDLMLRKQYPNINDYLHAMGLYTSGTGGGGVLQPGANGVFNYVPPK